MEVYLQNSKSGCLFFPAPSGAPSGGRSPLEIKHAYPNTPCHVVSEYIWLGWSISKTHILVVCFSCTFRSTVGGKHPLEMKYPYPRNFCHVVSEYMVRMVYFQNSWSYCLVFPAPSGAPSGGRLPLKMKYCYPGSLCHVVLEYIWLRWFISKMLRVVACFSCTFKTTFRREAPLENEKYLP